MDERERNPQSETGVRTGVRSALRSTFAYAFLLAGASILAIFGAFEIAERTWLAGADPGLARILHLARGIGSTLIAVLLVCVYVIRTSPPILAGVPSEQDWLRARPAHDEAHLDQCARWFIRMRWVAVLAASGLSCAAVRVAHLLPPDVWWPLQGTAAVLALFNLLFLAMLKRQGRKSSLLLLQMYADLGILTLLLHFSGGIENPLSLLMLVHVIIGGILLSRRRCYGVAAASGALFALLAWAEGTRMIPHHTLYVVPGGVPGDIHAAHQPLYVVCRVILQGVLLFLVAHLVTVLADRVRAHEAMLTTLADRAVTERRLLEQALETTGTGLRVLRRDLQPRWINDQWRRWFDGAGAPPSAGDGGHGNGRCAAAAAWDGRQARDTLEDGRVRSAELALQPSGGPGAAAPDPRRDDGRVLQVVTAPLRDEAGGVRELVELARDVTAEKETQARLIRASRLAAVGELAGNVAHEVNNPVAIISAKARLLLSDHRNSMSGAVAAEIGKIVDLTDRVARIAQGLLSWCRPSPAARSCLDLREPVRRMLAMVESRARTAGVAIEDRLGDAPAVVQASGAEMEQVFLNLCLNALDAMPGGGTLTVTLRREPPEAAGAPSRVAVEVADTGGGIPEDIRGRIFEPFFTTKAEGRGTGLGLSICHGCVRGHGGDIEVASRPGGGSTFTIRLPAALS